MNSKKITLTISLFLFLFIFIIIATTKIFKNFPSQKNKNSSPSQVVSKNKKSALPQVIINDVILHVEVAATPQQKSKGLSGHQPLKENQGMLFVYNPPEKVIFWMKDMNFPIDIIYLSKNKVLQIYSQVPNQPKTPISQLKLYPSNQVVDYVLETPSGWSQRHNIKINTPVAIKNIF